MRSVLPATRPFARLALAFVLSIGATIGSLGMAEPAQAQTFTDIADSPFRTEIEWLAAQGITAGCGGGRYCPREPVTRGQMASFLVRRFGYDVVPTADPFDDDDASIHEADINRLFAAGITAGCGAGRYCPRSPVERAEMATFLARALDLAHGAGSDHFADDDSSVHEADLDRIWFAGIGGACGADRACPHQAVTRGQMAAFLWRSAFAEPIGPAGLADEVTYAEPITVTFDGPARWRGVAFSADGTTASLVTRYGSIPDRPAGADRTALFNAVRYAHLVDGPLAGTWVKVDTTLTQARGRVPRPPACSYADLLTSRTAYDQWATTLLDTIYRLPASYAPGDRVDTAAAGLNGGHSVRGLVAADLAEMAAAARANGTPIQVASAYRSYDQQIATFNHWVSVGGYQAALERSARPGHSEHQLGTTLDVTSAGGAPPWQYADWAATPAGAWMAANAWRYGFVMSYPRGSQAVACYTYEPWHYRYVGRELAAAVVGSGMTLREAIWAAHGP